MGKSSKKSSSKVDAPVIVDVDAVPSKHLKKGKREAKDNFEKPTVRAKKQKVEEKKVIKVDDSPFSESKQSKVKASAKKVTVTKKIIVSTRDSSSSDDDDNVTLINKVHVSLSKIAPVVQKKVDSSDESGSDDDVVTVSQKVPSANNNNSHIASTKKKDNSISDDSSSSDGTSSDDDIAAAKKVHVDASQKKISSNSNDSSSSSDDETSSDDNVTATKKVESSSDESSSDDDHDVVTVPKKFVSAINNKGHIASFKKKVDSTSDDSSSDETSSDHNVALAKKVRVATSPKKFSSSSGDSSSDDETSSDNNVTAAKKVPIANVAATQYKGESSSDDSSSDDETNSDDNVAATKKIPPAMTHKSHVTATRKNAESSSDDTSSDDNVTAAKKVPSALPKKAMSEDTSSDSDDESSSDDDVTTAKKVSATLPKKAESSSEDTESDSEDKTMQRSNAKLQVKIKAIAEGESSDESDDEPQKKRRKDADVKVTAVEKIKTTAGKDGSPSENTNYTRPKTPTKPKGQTGSKIVFVGNLSYSVEKHDVENFFKVVGKVVDVRFGMNPDNTFKGFGHVEFASREAAQKAVGELNKKELLGRLLRLDLAREKGAFTPPSSGRDTQSYQKRGREQWHQLYVRGFNKDVGEDEIRNSLLKHFGSCGDIAKINLPVDQEGGVKGFGYISFRDRDAFNKGLGLNGSKIGGKALYLEEARPRKGRDSAPSNKNGDRDSAGRNRADHRVTPNRGRVTANKRRVTNPSRPSITTVATGKKTTFDDNDD